MHIISTKKNLDYIKIAGCKLDILLVPSKFWSFKLKIFSEEAAGDSTGQADVRLSRNVEIFRYFQSNIDFLLLKVTYKRL